MEHLGIIRSIFDWVWDNLVIQTFNLNVSEFEDPDVDGTLNIVEYVLCSDLG